MQIRGSKFRYVLKKEKKILIFNSIG